MKKLVKILICVLIVVALGGIAFGGYVGYRVWLNKPYIINSYEEIYTQPVTTLQIGSDGLLNVLKINDTHLLDGECATDKRTLDGLKIILDKTPVDMVVVNGDLVDGFNLKPSYDKYQAIDKFCTLLETYETPWTFAPGNNDGEIDGTNRDVIAYMMRYDNFICGNVEDIYGDMQFFIDVKSGDALVHTIAIMDSGMRKPKITGKYDYMHETQIEWLLDGVNSRGVAASVFFHMQTPAFESAYYDGILYQNMPYGKTSDYDSIPKNKLFDDMTKDCEYIKLLSVGHQHGNAMTSYYEGRYYQLSSPSGYSAWYPDGFSPSCTLTIIDVNAVDTQDIYSFYNLSI
ncbi:MAG: metallophosphoesterase [Clostridia bacterium]|nr:metallophosphoesterase [Clostridia bacterium]